MDEVLWEVTWIDATMYLAMIPNILPDENKSDNDVEYVSPEDETKFIQFGAIN